MQHPVGYTLNNGRAELTDFGAVLTNRVFTTHFPHVLSAGLTTGAFFVIGISAYHLVRNNETDFFKRSIKVAAIVGVIGTVIVGFMGHLQGQLMVEIQPTKLAAMEAIRHAEDPADLSLLTIPSLDGDTDIVDIRIPYLLSIMLYNRPTGGVQGMTELQAELEQKYGPGNYIPPVIFTYWTFRAMVGIGLLLLAAVALLIVIIWKDLYQKFSWFLKILPWIILLPYLANSTGWMLTEIGRYPWVVYGLLKMENGVSTAVSGGMLLTSLIGFVLVYALLMLATAYLMLKFAKAGPEPKPPLPPAEELFPLPDEGVEIALGGSQ
jgi:cytochrome d ubiquinol oxidase subunit I